MKRIIILGCKGKLGNKLSKNLILNNLVFDDQIYKLDHLISIEFINKNKIDLIINCIGSTNKDSLFFSSNVLIPNNLSDKISTFDSKLEKSLCFMHISSIGVYAPFMNYNFKALNFNNPHKLKIKYNLYELSKACGELIIRKNLKDLANISTVIIQPSNIICEDSIFIMKLKYFLILFPFRIPHNRKIPISTIDLIMESIKLTLESKPKNSIQIKKLYKRVKLSSIFKGYKIIKLFKIPLKLSIAERLIKKIPDYSILISFKRMLIFLFIL